MMTDYRNSNAYRRIRPTTADTAPKPVWPLRNAAGVVWAEAKPCNR